MADRESSGEYGVISFHHSWGLLSLLFFAASMTTRLIVRLLPPELQGYDSIPPLATKAVPVLALLGLLAAITGWRRQTKDAIAGFGLVLNAIVLALSLLFLSATWLWWTNSP